MKQKFNIRGKLRHSIFFILLTLSFTMSAQGQGEKVQGVVTGAEDGSPIPGVSVTLERNGKTIGVTTDFDGEYSIEAQQGEVLKFSYMGMADQEVTVNGNTVNTAMTADVDELEEVIVIGYGAVKKKEVTGAVVRVKAEQLEEINTPDLGIALQGQAAGVNVISSADPGGQSEILIRGITTIGDNTPLYVVDGIAQEGDPGINPSDIETIDILKDASSTAIYGSRGAAGVILITTKQGKPGSLRVRLNASYAVNVLNPSQQLMNSVDQTYFDIVSRRNSEGAFDDDANGFLRVLRSPYNLQNETDLSKTIFRDNTPTQNYNANISGGTDDITYNVMLGLFKQEGLLINSGFERFNTRVNTSYKKNKISINSSVGLSYEDRDIPQGWLIQQSIRYSPTQDPVEPGATDPALNFGGSDANRQSWLVETINTTRKQKGVRTNASVALNYQITDDLSVRGTAAATSHNIYESQFRPYRLVVNLENGNVSNPSNSFVRNDASRRTSLYLEGLLTYKKEFIKDHNVTFTYGTTYEKYIYEGFFARRAGATDPDIEVLNSAVLAMDVGNLNNYTNILFGTLGRMQYDYKGKYVFSSSFRYDGTSKFESGNKWAIFPSMAFAWNVSDENFWNSFKNVANSFKVRVSSGTVGNQSVQAYIGQGVIQQNVDGAFAESNASGISEQLGRGAGQIAYPNEDVKWETTRQSNIGFDLGMFKNKFTVTGEYYYSDKEDMLFPVFIPPSNGGGANARVIYNVGNMTNQGFELAMGLRGKTGKVNWRMNGTFATNKNEITKIDGQSDFLFTDDFGLVQGATNQSRVTAHAVGHEAGSFFLLTTDGIADTEEKLAEFQKLLPSARMGDVIFKDNNGDGVISDLDRVYSGSGLPKYEIGYTFNANWKSFDFSMNWYAALGQKIMNGSRATAVGYGRHRDNIYQWSEANPVTPIYAWRGDTTRHLNSVGYSDLWLEDGSYLRLRAISLGYSLTKKTIEKLGVNRVRFYVRAQNPFTFTNYSGYNPEVGGGVSARGLDKGVTPVSAQYLLGLNFNF